MAATGDKVAPLWRSRNNKDANNITRNLFRQTIIDMFGGEANIPANVRNAMRLKDYDHLFSAMRPPKNILIFFDELNHKVPVVPVSI